MRLRLHLAAGMLWALLGGGLGLPAEGPFKSLGWGRRPPPKPLPPVPPVLWQMFQKRRTNAFPDVEQNPKPCWVEEFNVQGNTVRLLPDQGHYVHRTDPPCWLCLEKRLYFNFSTLDEGEQVTMVQLEIKLKQNQYWSWSPDHPFELSLYKANQMALRGLSTHAYSRALFAEQSFPHLHRSFTFNLTAVAREWQTPAKNLGLILEISIPTATSPQLCSGLDSLFLDASLLVVSLAPEQCKATRRRRSPYTVPVAASNICKPRRLYVSFSDIGWENWIIAPQGYLANYCLGECPFPLTEELNSTNHAILQTMMHSLDPEHTPQPCCVPVRLSPISILYYDNNDNVVLRHYEDMVVDECGCR